MYEEVRARMDGMVDAFYASNPTNDRGHQLSRPVGEFGISELPEPLKTEVALEHTRYLENLRDFDLDPTGPAMQLLLQTRSHRHRLNKFKAMLEQAQKRLGARLALQSLGASSAACDGAPPPPPEARRLEQSNRPLARKAKRSSSGGALWTALPRWNSDGSRIDETGSSNFVKADQSGVAVLSDGVVSPTVTPWRVLSRETPPEEAWLDDWRRRFGCWFRALPARAQSQLQGCAGALALHLGSRIEASLGTARGGGGGSQGVECGWIGEEAPHLRTLPEFPPFPSNFRLPPLPRLAPLWQRLHAGAGAGGEGTAAHTQPDAPTWAGTATTGAVAAASIGAGVGGAAAAAAAVWVVRRHEWRVAWRWGGSPCAYSS